MKRTINRLGTPSGPVTLETATDPLIGAIRHGLATTRERTWLLADGLPDAYLKEPAAPYLSPPNWDLGHMANFEELWLVQRLGEQPELRAGFNDIYNSFQHAREERPHLRLLDREGLHAYMAAVRERTLAILDRVDLGADRLTRDGFVYQMLILHEQQHQETLLQSFVMRAADGQYTPPAPRPLPQGTPRPAWCPIPAGVAEIGTTHTAGTYDNEAPAHRVTVAPFEMAKYPVSNGDYLAFVESGGYDDPTWWSPRGREWLAKEPHHAPLYWHRIDGAWHRTDLTGTAPVLTVRNEILCHVTYFEAEAYARWAGARLPTEAEWERAARGPTTAASPPRYPWGDAPADSQRANIDQLGLHPSTVGAYPQSASPFGVEHMIGDVWEWCSTGFDAYPGFVAYPYDQYSKVFFGGDYHILRGGAWAACAGCATATFRNWDHPYRRQIFSGIRLVRDVP